MKIPTEVFSRVSGYYRPVKQWNKGKQEEWGEREMLKVKEDLFSGLSLDIMIDLINDQLN